MPSSSNAGRRRCRPREGEAWNGWGRMEVMSVTACVGTSTVGNGPCSVDLVFSFIGNLERPSLLAAMTGGDDGSKGFKG